MNATTIFAPMEKEYPVFSQKEENNLIDVVKSEEIDISSVIDFGHKMPLLICLYFYAPAIAIVIYRDWYSPTLDLATRLYQQSRCIVWDFTIIVTIAYRYLKEWSNEQLDYNKLYLCSAPYMSLFIVLLSYGFERKSGARCGIIIAYFGIVLSFVTTIVMYLCGEHKSFVIMYNVGVAFFMFGNAVIVHILTW